ncbi:hypothetical protein ONZ43_g5769 [Nemania bipapillata]|uniref:Uncharacterized protein n=1 Tax=Nemania bipapillata TaxID=110536 RepID=A0ACC2I6Q9_9PEZI|nr:hypothetical protein ONZ43_g5769 [Nemania bipapillata]
MATATMTTTATITTSRKKDANLPPENERFLRCCADIANVLIEDHEASKDPKNPRRDINLNGLRTKLSRKHRLKNIPPLTAIIAAIPEHYKKYIMPKLIAKPIRTCLRLHLRLSLSLNLSLSLSDACLCMSVAGVRAVLDHMLTTRAH